MWKKLRISGAGLWAQCRNLQESLWEVTLYFKGTVHPRRKNNWLSTLILIESLVKFCGPQSIKNSQSPHTSVFTCYLVACVTHNKESCSDFAASSASIRSNIAFLAFDLLSYCCSFFSGHRYTKNMIWGCSLHGCINREKHVRWWVFAS